VKVIAFCPHLDRDDKERKQLTKMFYRKQHEGRFFIIQELCENCLEQLTRGIAATNAKETTH